MSCSDRRSKQLAWLVALTLLAVQPAYGSDEADGAALVVFLVRHAEKADSSADPPLTEAGHERAQRLARILRDAGIEHVHSSDYIRTRDTAAPLATHAGLAVASYDPGDLPAMAERLKAAGGRHLVVGHSNTTPPLVGLLGGEPGADIEEKHEYDRLYVVTVGKDGAVSTVLLRYGNPSPEG